MESRTVRAGHGWTWITEGFALFRKSPANWLALILLLFAATKLLAAVSLLGIVFVLLMPIFIAGLMEGCRALERGEPLQLAHLTCGFRKNAAQLVTIGGISLIGNLAVMMLIISMGGDAMSTMTKTLSEGTPAPAPSAEIQAASVTVARALLVGTLVSLPLLMALWYAPLLIHFNDLGALGAMKSSLVACAKNAPAMVVFGGAVLGGMFLAMPFAMALRQYDLALWLLAPVVLPSLYVSYKDIYLAGAAPEHGPAASV
ncbi:MAG TPA: BPSS1780 family membrane protein [Burkholderiales bacterium]|jgi:hypothetical protein|nr:BPSS1780 family membrane protein [Burkholderiales bacterium]